MKGMRWAFASLTSRLVVTAVLLVALVALLIGSAATFALHSYLTHRLDNDLQSFLSQAVEQHLHGEPLGEPGDGDSDTRPLDRPRNDILIGLTAPTGTSASIRTDDGYRRVPTSTVADLTAVPTDGGGHEVEVPGHGEYRVAVERVPDGFVIVGLPTTSVDGPVSRLVLWDALVGALGIVGAAGAGTYVVRRQLRPLREVAATAHNVAALPLASGEIELAERVPERLTDERTEVGQVGSALNTLLAHVESSLAERHRSEQQVRRFVADASHELRTPLTTIAGYTELARRHPHDSGAVKTALEKVEEEAGRMTAMVEDLLLLARLDAGRPLGRDRVDLSRLLVEAVSDARVVAPAHRWQLRLPEDSIEVNGDADRLHQVISNLLTNARKHTPAGTTVTVTAASSGFSVHDDGPGFPSDVAATAFERFARGDASRTRATEGLGGGAGLGLSLVDAIISAHGGTVTLESHPGSTTLTVSLPP